MACWWPERGNIRKIFVGTKATFGIKRNSWRVKCELSVRSPAATHHTFPPNELLAAAYARHLKFDKICRKNFNGFSSSQCCSSPFHRLRVRERVGEVFVFVVF